MADADRVAAFTRAAFDLAEQAIAELTKEERALMLQTFLEERAELRFAVQLLPSVEIALYMAIAGPPARYIPFGRYSLQITTDAPVDVPHTH